MSDQPTFYFDEDFQLGIFELMMNDSGFCEKALAMLKAEYFANKYLAWFFDKQRELKETHGSAPTHTQIKNEINRFAIEKRVLYIKIFNNITKPTRQRDHNYIRKNLEEFVKKAMRFQINDLLVKNQNKDSDYIDEIIQDRLTEYTNVNFGSTQCQSIGHLSTMMAKSAEEAQNLIPTYMPSMDMALGGGVPRGTLTLGLSGTNVGKSIWLINWAYHLIKHGFKVLYVNLEGYEAQPMLRLAARAIGTGYGKVRHNDLTDIEAQKKDHFETTYRDSLQLFHNNSFGFTIEDLVPIVRAKKEEFDFDVLMVDYGQLLNSKKKFGELRHEQAYVHRGLAALAGELDVATVTVAQGNRNTQEKNDSGKGLIRMTDIAECFEICRACSTIFTLNRSDQDIEMGTSRVFMDKSRDGKRGVIETMRTNLERLAFYGTKEEGLGFMEMNDYIYSQSQMNEKKKEKKNAQG